MNYLSESVLKGMCDIVGTEDYVALKRKIIDIFESRNGLFIIEKQPISTILSESRREGFRFENSDIDIMCGLDYLRVVWNPFQQLSYSPLETVLLIFDGSDSPPGYGLLDIPGLVFVLPFLREKKIREYLTAATFYKKGKWFVSSSIIRLLVRGIPPFHNEHGPCASESVGSIEIDNACCLTSDFWPPTVVELSLIHI